MTLTRRSVHWKAITYTPKIDAILTGACTQTIRPGWGIVPYDKIGLFTWEGSPYRSKWAWKQGPFEVESVYNITVEDEGFHVRKRVVGNVVSYMDVYNPWDSPEADHVARADYIDPPTGTALRGVLRAFYGNLNGNPMQIIRWKPPAPPVPEPQPPMIDANTWYNRYNFD